MGFPSAPLGMVMLVPVPLSLTGVGSGPGVVGFCAKATPVSVTVDTIVNEVIQAVRVMIVTSLSYVGRRRWPCPRTIPGSGRIRQPDIAANITDSRRKANL